MESLTLPFALPPWVPGWVPIVLLVPTLLYALALIVMPFGVIGVKGRLEALDARLDGIHAELRHLAARLPEPAARRGFEDIGYTPPILPETGQPKRSQGAMPRMAAPPVVDRLEGEFDPRRRIERVPVRPMRAEPRLDRPASMSPD